MVSTVHPHSSRSASNHNSPLISDATMTILQNLYIKAEDLKSKGNQGVVAKNYPQAQLYYEEALRITQNVLDKCHEVLRQNESQMKVDAGSAEVNLGQMESININSFNSKVEKMFIALHSNQSLVKIRMGLWEEAVECCDHVIHKFFRSVGITSVDGKHEIVTLSETNDKENAQNFMKTAPQDASKCK